MATGRVPTTANSPLTAKGDLFGYSTTQARVAVGNDGETLVADSSTSTGLRYAATYAAGKNVIINGSMDIDQRNTATTASTTTAGVSSIVFGPDRMRLFSNNAGVFSIQQVQDAPPGFRYSCKITTTTADASVTGADRANFAQFVENANWNRFAWGTASAKPITSSFWVKSSVTGTYFICINVSGGGAAYYTTYTINSADTWEYKAITIPGPTAASTWATNSVDVVFGGLCAGPDRQTSTLNSWTTDGTPALGTSSTVNLVSTLNATWQITGWQIEEGSVATAFTRSAGTIQGELAACKRYYQRITVQDAFGRMSGVTPAATTSAVYCIIQHEVQMRVPPTSLDYSLVGLADGVNSVITPDSLSLNAAGVNITTVQGQATGLLTQMRSYFLLANNSTSAYLGFSAEL